jgi:hypothetical protein
MSQELEDRRTELINEIQTIEVQLGERNRTNLEGERMSSEDYWHWRRQAHGARRAKLVELRDINAQLRHNGSGKSSRYETILERMDIIEEKLDKAIDLLEDVEWEENK